MQHCGEAVIDVGVARVLAQAPDIVDLVGQLVAEDVLFTVVGVEPGLADEGVAIELAVGVLEYRAHCRQALGLGHVVVFLVLAVEGQAGVVVDVPGEAGSQQHALLFGIVDFGVAVVGQAGEAVQEGALLVELAAEVECAVAPIIAASTQHHLVDGLDTGALGDHVDDAAGLVLAVQHRGGALENLDPFEQVGSTCSAPPVLPPP